MGFLVDVLGIRDFFTYVILVSADSMRSNILQRLKVCLLRRVDPIVHPITRYLERFHLSNNVVRQPSTDLLVVWNISWRLDVSVIMI